MTMKWAKGMALLPLLLLTACSTTAERPGTPVLPDYAEPDSRCRDITGRYRATPHAFGGQQQEERPLLALTLLADTPGPAEAAEVALSVEAGGGVVVRVYDSQAVLLQQQRHAVEAGVFRCDDGQLEFYPARLDPETPGIAWESVVLRKTVDGSLMLRKGGLFSGLTFMLIPIAVSTENWYLFKPVPE